MERNRYFISCHVSPFVKRYLEVNFGYVGKNRSCFDIRSDGGLYTYLRSLSTNEPLLTHESRGAMFKWRTEVVNFEISEFAAEHDGRNMTVTEQIKFCNLLEARCKNIMRTYMLSLATIVSNEAECIRLFYKITGWGEKSWPSKSIRKILERDRKTAHDSFKPIASVKGVFERVADICASTLAQQNNITTLGKNTYEYNSNKI